MDFVSCNLAKIVYYFQEFWEFFWIFYRDIKIIYKDSFISYFQSVYFSISFSCLTALDRTSTTIWKRSSEREYSCLVHDLSGKN